MNRGIYLFGRRGMLKKAQPEQGKAGIEARRDLARSIGYCSMQGCSTLIFSEEGIGFVDGREVAVLSEGEKADVKALNANQTSKYVGEVLVRLREGEKAEDALGCLVRTLYQNKTPGYEISYKEIETIEERYAHVRMVWKNWEGRVIAGRAA